KGVANVDDLHTFGIRSRIRATLWEIYQYQHFNNPGGHSLAMRFEFWKTAFSIISDHPFTGVGTGDVPTAFKNKYDELKSPLAPQYRLRAHNQYLTVAIALGIPVLVWFLLSLILPGIILNRYNYFLYFTFAFAHSARHYFKSILLFSLFYLLANSHNVHDFRRFS